MSISDKFESFCKDLRMPSIVVNNVSYRYHRIIHQLNDSYYSINNDSSHGLYVGSYGRGTAINTSDIDMLFVMPYSVYTRYNAYTYNGQSALLQDVKTNLQKTYQNSHISADGQVIVISFSDNITFEIVPCFLNSDNSYTYPDSNDGGHWRITNPKPEIEAINNLNNVTNKNLKRLCRMIRSWKEEHNIPMGGLLIDTLAHKFLSSWEYNKNGYAFYDWMTRDFFKYLSEIDDTQSYWLAIGSGQYIYRRGNFAYKAKQAYNAAVEAINYENQEYTYLADIKWREIYGNRFNK